MSKQENFEELSKQANFLDDPALLSALPVLIQALKISDEATTCGNKRERMRQKLLALSPEERAAVKNLLLCFTHK